MTTTEHSVHVVPAGVRRRGRQLPLVPAVGSPFDEWSTVALPVVVRAGFDPAAFDPAGLDPATVALPVVTAARSAVPA